MFQWLRLYTVELSGLLHTLGINTRADAGKVPLLLTDLWLWELVDCWRPKSPGKPKHSPSQAKDTVKSLGSGKMYLVC